MDSSALFATIICVVGLVALYHPQFGPRLYRADWPGYQGDARRRRLAYTAWSGFSSALLCLSLADLLRSTRHERLMIASFYILALAFIAGWVGLVAALRLRSPRV